MSITKGAMLISNANAVGAELVNQLGGTGYKPVEWADKINLLGIRDDDKASALAGITSGTYTGDERGAIHYSNCNAVGAMLNKKFSTDRGFKPVEWESAISKLTPLAEGTVSGDICTIVNGADDVPTKSLVVTIPATRTGTSLVTETQTGRNIMPNEKVQGASTRVNIGQTDDDYSLHLKAGTYTLSATSLVQMRAYYRTSTGGSNVLIWSTYDTSGSGTFTLSEDSDVRIWLYNGDGLSVSDIQTFQLEVGSTAHDYEPYNPTTYTASLGLTIYGGTADIVNGTGTDENGNDFTFTGQEVPTRLGYNAFWSDSGDTEVTYRKDPDIPDPPVQLLNMNNENNENNDN